MEGKEALSRRCGRGRPRLPAQPRGRSRSRCLGKEDVRRLSRRGNRPSVAVAAVGSNDDVPADLAPWAMQREQVPSAMEARCAHEQFASTREVLAAGHACDAPPASFPRSLNVASTSQHTAGPITIGFVLGAAIGGLAQSALRFVADESWLPSPSVSAYPQRAPSGPRPPTDEQPEAAPAKEEPPREKSSWDDADPDAEPVEWVNMCVRRIWRVYQRGLEGWISGLLQPVFDTYINKDMGPSILRRIRIQDFSLSHEAPSFSNMQRRNARKDSDLNGIFDVRYSGSASMILALELGAGLEGMEIPVMVQDFDLDASMWIKLRLAPVCPWIGSISLAFVDEPRIQFELKTFGMLPLMRIPLLQNFLQKLLAVDLPKAMVLPQRLEINLPPSVTVLAEAAVGRDTVMRAVASAVLQADALEQHLKEVLPTGPIQPWRSAVEVPEAFVGELSVQLVKGRGLPVWGFPLQSNPYCRLELGCQVEVSKRDSETGARGAFRSPTWHQGFHFLVENPLTQALQITVLDSPYTGQPDVGRATLPLKRLLLGGSSRSGGTLKVWLPVETRAAVTSPHGEIGVIVSYRSYDDIDGAPCGGGSSGAAADGPGAAGGADAEIKDVPSAAAAFSREMLEMSQAIDAMVITNVATVRAATKHSQAAARLGPVADVHSISAALSAEEGASSNGASMALSPHAASGSEESGRAAGTGQPAGALDADTHSCVASSEEADSIPYSSRHARGLDALADAAAAAGAAARKERDEAAEAGVSAAAILPGKAIRARPSGASRPKLLGQKSPLRKDLELLAEGDGSASSLLDAQGTRSSGSGSESDDAGPHSRRPPPLLPSNLSGIKGAALNSLLVRQASTRVRPTGDEDLNDIQAGRTVNLRSRRNRRHARHMGHKPGLRPQYPHPSQLPACDEELHDLTRDTIDIPSPATACNLPPGAAPLPLASGRGRDLRLPPGGPESHPLDTVDLLESDADEASDAEDGAVSQIPPLTRGSTDASQVMHSTHTRVQTREHTHRRLHEVPAAERPGPHGARPGGLDAADAPAVPVAPGTAADGSHSGLPGGSGAAWPQDRPFLKGARGPPGGAGGSTGVRDEEVAGEKGPWSRFLSHVSSMGQRRDSDADSTHQAGGVQSDEQTPQAATPQSTAPADESAEPAEPQAWWSHLARVLPGQGPQEAAERPEGADGRKSPKKAAEPAQAGPPAPDSGVEDVGGASKGQMPLGVRVAENVPLEAIVRELHTLFKQRDQEGSQQARKENAKLMAGPIQRLRQLNDYLTGLSKPEVALLCTLTGGVLVLLAVVAHRLELYIEYERIIRELSSR